jgi:hypothetical protein
MDMLLLPAADAFKLAPTKTRREIHSLRRIGFGLLAVALQWYAISQPILGGEVPFVLLTPLGTAQLLNGGWLLVRGFGPVTVDENVEGR